MKLRNKIIIIFLAAILLLAGIYAISIGVRLQQTEQSYGKITYVIPKGSLYVKQYGSIGRLYKTTRSEEEIQQFYEDYFATLTPVSQSGRQGLTDYYDPERGVIYEGISTFSGDGYFPTQFTVWIWPWDASNNVSILENQ